MSVGLLLLSVVSVGEVDKSVVLEDVVTRVGGLDGFKEFIFGGGSTNDSAPSTCFDKVAIVFDSVPIFVDILKSFFDRSTTLNVGVEVE